MPGVGFGPHAGTPVTDPGFDVRPGLNDRDRAPQGDPAMERRRELRIAIILAAGVSIVSGCSRDVPTSTEVATLHSSSGSGPSSSARAVTFFGPEAIASVRKLPELGIFEGGGVDGDAQSTYFRTTDANREFRRGFAEFAIPGFRDVFSARIVLRETRAGISHPLPADRHELSYYTEVDRIVDIGDFDRSTTALGTFETDANLPAGTFEFDVSRLVTRLRGAALGFRIKLEADPTYAGTGFLGSAFSGSSTPAGVRIEVTTTAIEANEFLRGRVGSMGLEPRLEATLLASLRQVAAILGDRDPSNDRSACAELTAFITEVASHEQDGLLSAPQFTDLEELAGNIKTAIGCR